MASGTISESANLDNYHKQSCKMLQTMPLIKKDFKTAKDLHATLYEFAGATITKCHRLWSPKQQSCIFSPFWRLGVPGECQQGLVIFWASLLSLQMAVFSPCPDTVSLCVHPWCLSVCPTLLLLEGQQSDRMGAHPQGLILTKLIL